MPFVSITYHFYTVIKRNLLTQAIHDASSACNEVSPSLRERDRQEGYFDDADAEERHTEDRLRLSPY